MKKIIQLFLMLFALTALMTFCVSQPEPEVVPGYEYTSLNPDFLEDMELIESLFAAGASGDAQVMESMLHEDFVVEGPGKESRNTRQQEIDWWVNFSTQVEDFALSNKIYYSIIADEMEDMPGLKGKWVFLWCDMSYRQIHDGKKIEFPLHIAFMVKEGKVVYAMRYFDQLSVNRQAGYKLVPIEE
jgi:ketosteroid isomerase-like protein